MPGISDYFNEDLHPANEKTCGNCLHIQGTFPVRKELNDTEWCEKILKYVKLNDSSCEFWKLYNKE